MKTNIGASSATPVASARSDRFVPFMLNGLYCRPLPSWSSNRHTIFFPLSALSSAGTVMSVWYLPEGNGMSEVAVGGRCLGAVAGDSHVAVAPDRLSAAVIFPFPFASLVSILFLLAAAAPSARAGRALPKTTGVQWSTNAPIAPSSVVGRS